MAKFYLILASSMLAVLLSGCGSIGNLYTYKGNGVLYTHKVEPLTHHYTPIQVAQADKNSSGDETELQFRYVTVLWGEERHRRGRKEGGISDNPLCRHRETEHLVWYMVSEYCPHLRNGESGKRCKLQSRYRRSIGQKWGRPTHILLFLHTFQSAIVTFASLGLK